MEWNERMERIKEEEARGKKQETRKNPETENKPLVENKKVEIVEPVKPTPANQPIDREKQKELQKLKRRLRNLETELDNAKQEKIQLEAALGDPSNYSDPKKFQVLEAQYKQAQHKWDVMNKEYEEVFEKVMEADV